MARKKPKETVAPSTDNQKADPTRYFHLNDVSLWEASLRRHRELRWGEDTKENCATQTFRSVEPEMYEVELEGEGEKKQILLRILVKLGTRMVRPSDDDEIDAIYTLEATFCADYFLLDEPTQEIFDKFVSFNCIHNVWPFWRQHVFDTLKRAELPVPTVPLYAGQTKYRRKKVRITRSLRTDSDQFEVEVKNKKGSENISV